VTTDDALRLGGVEAAELAATYGTPLLALDTDVLDAALATFAEVGRTLDIDVAYAAKALIFVALARRIAATPLGLDVCSLGELLTAERGGFAPGRLVMHGCGKSDAELQAATEGRVGRIVVDHRDELERLAARADPARPLRVLLRINAGIEAHTHAYVRTGGEESKFGFGLNALDEAAAFVLATPGLRLTGIHTHLGSQIFDATPYVAAASVALDAFERTLALGATASELILGGGFGVDSRPGGDSLDVSVALGEIAAGLRAEAARRGIRPPRLGIEPGRAIVAAAGTSLYRVVAVKRQGARRFAIVDGGIADNPRPALYGAYHPPRLASRRGASGDVETTVCGRSCENDRLVVAPLPADLRAGDVIAMGTTGAYTYSMASNYNRFPKPAVVLVGRGTHRLAVRRQSDADLLRDDVIESAADEAAVAATR
jgi:diaminopimelate decarboxylase